MINNRLFKTAFIFSLILHGIILLYFSGVRLPKNKPVAACQISYYNEMLAAKSNPVRQEPVPLPVLTPATVKELLLAGQQPDKRKTALNPLLLEERWQQLEQLVKDRLAQQEKNIKTDDTAVPAGHKKDIVATPLAQTDAESQACYINYYRLINEQLRQAVIKPQWFEEGEITLTFVVNADGSLSSVTVLPERSSQNDDLRQTAMQIVRNASPFPPFPQELRKIELTFNVVICFRERT